VNFLVGAQRRLNQIAHVANQIGRIVGPDQGDLRAFLKVCGAVRDHVKALLKARIDAEYHRHQE
jgi:hypothetical protein